MIPLTFLDYELKEKPDRILKNLRWSVEEVETSWIDNFTNWKLSTATHKPWIGKIDRRDLEFSLEEPGPFLKRRFNVVVKGKLELKTTTTKVRIRVGLDNLSFLWTLMLYLGGALFITEAFINEDFDSHFVLVSFLIAYPVLGTFLISRRMKLAETKLDQIFE